MSPVSFGTGVKLFAAYAACLPLKTKPCLCRPERDAIPMSKTSICIALFLATLVSSGSAGAITSFTASLRWSFQMGSYVKAGPKISADGLTVYGSSGEGCAPTANTMFALSTDKGSLQWQVDP